MNFDIIFDQLFEEYEGGQALPSGIRKLDTLIDGGFVPELVTIVGRPGHGKTMFLLNLMTNFSFYQGFKGMLVAYNQSPKSLTRKLISILGNSDNDIASWEDGVLLDKLTDVKKLLQERVNVMYKPNNLEDVLNKSSASKASYLIIDDFTQLFSYAHISAKVYAEALERLQSFAKDTQIPVFISLLASSSVERRGGDQMPMLLDVPRSDSTLHHSAKVMMLYRAMEIGISLDMEGESTENKMDVLLLKNSSGKTGNLTLDFSEGGRVF